MTRTLHNDGAPRRAHTYPVPVARELDDSERNQLSELRHEACEDHCTECGCCDWFPTGPTTERPVPIIDGLCPDCTPADLDPRAAGPLTMATFDECEAAGLDGTLRDR